MRLVSLKVSGYRQFLDQITLQIPPGLIGICGPNGVGKSKLIEAIGYALYGPASAILPRTDRVGDLVAKAGKAVPHVELEIEIRGQHYVICRTTRGKTSIQFNGAADSIASGASAVTQKVIELLRLTADAFCGTFVARQNEMLPLKRERRKSKKSRRWQGSCKRRWRSRMRSSAGKSRSHSIRR